MHSHLIPGIDDGAQTLEESIEMIRYFASLGYRKLITTPHIIHDYYENTPEIIEQGLQQVRDAVAQAGIDLTIEAAAEYYLDEYFAECLKERQPLLTFGGNYVLVETSFLNAPILLEALAFQLQAVGYQPVLAHPERYQYLQNDFSMVERLLQMGLLMQVNILSLGGYYSKGARRCAERMIDQGWVHMLGSDCHRRKHLEEIEAIRQKNAYYRKAVELPLLNYNL
ncbi:tyrosine-protein phosphatase [Catalinimonas alkaloidigena]|nr:CpsB/CapC family capsule biosynthesis tyrosine phosphatase [Catalinimonas alkaloidigena]